MPTAKTSAPVIVPPALGRSPDKSWSPVLDPDTEEAPAPIVRTEVFATFAVRVRVPPFTVRAVVSVAFVTDPAVNPAAVPVMFVPTKAVGVPRAGVTSVGEVAKTTEPEPVVVAAEIAVPLDCNRPVMLHERVMAGVVVEVATEPARPLALTTETSVTVPPPPPPAIVSVTAEPKAVPVTPAPRKSIEVTEAVNWTPSSKIATAEPPPGGEKGKGVGVTVSLPVSNYSIIKSGNSLL